MKRVVVNEIPNEQDVTIKTINTTSLNPESNIKVFMKDTNDNVLEESTSNANGEVIFNDVAGGTEVYFSVEGTASSLDIYTTSRGTYTVPTIDRISKQDTLLNYSVDVKPKYENGNTIPGDSIQSYLPDEYNLEALRGSDELYFDPANSTTATQIQHLKNFENTLGMKLFEYNTTTPYEDPTPEEKAAYQTFGPNKNYLDGNIGSNVLPVGTNTTMQGKTMDNGYYANIYSSTFAMGGTDESDNHHEAANRLKIKSRNGPSVTNSNGAANIPLGVDEARSILYSQKDGYNVYHGTELKDSQEIPLNYSELVSIKD